MAAVFWVGRGAELVTLHSESNMALSSSPKSEERKVVMHKFTVPKIQ